MTEKEKIMVFAPHPDDELIGCGGTVIKNIAHGARATIVYVTLGEFSGPKSEQKTKKIRMHEAKKVCRAIHAKAVFLHEQDIFLKNKISTLKKIVRLLRREKPTQIFYPHPDEEDPTHNQTTELVQIALLFCGKPVFPLNKKPWSIPKAFEYEVWTPIRRYNFTSDITKNIKNKIQLLKLYSSQIKTIDYPSATLALNRFRGITSGVGEYCEVFKLQRWGKTDDSITTV